jgi:Fis family transcriptional regulator
MSDDKKKNQSDQSHSSLSHCVEHALTNYFEQLNGESTTHLYDLFLAEVEEPLLKATLIHTQGKQSKAAEVLGLNRGTLRKKLKTYGLI